MTVNPRSIRLFAIGAIAATILVAGCSDEASSTLESPPPPTPFIPPTHPLAARFPVLPPVSFLYSDFSAPLPSWYTADGAGATVAAADNTPATNPTTDAGATLGRVLFYDTRLSGNGQLSCGSCHIQSLGFGDTARFSKGVGGRTARHTMSLANARFYARGHFFWDERAATLEDQVLQPIQNPVEMGQTLDGIVANVSAAGFYPPLFQAAFGTPEITSGRISLALAQFVRSLVSFNSKYDRAFANGGTPDFTVLTAQEQQGQQLFATSAGCGFCHSTNAVVANTIHNTGLDSTITDVGAGNGQFKAPSLRNVGLRSSFMHDGRFQTLQQVVAFYDSGVQANPSLDAGMRAADGTPRRLNLTQDQRDALVAFLNTLTDSTFITAAKFSDPFPKP